MNKTQIISYLKMICKLEDPDDFTADPLYLAMSDEDIETYILVAMAKQGLTDIDTIPTDDVYPTLLLARKDLYYSLAIESAPLTPISSSDGKLNKDVRFDHYMKLVKQVDDEYNSYLEMGQVVKVGEIILASRYHSARNYELATAPVCVLTADSVYSDKVELSWSYSNINRFYNSIIYYSSSQIIDEYSNTIPMDGAVTAHTTYDIHENKFRIEGLTPNTTYKIALLVQEANGLKGYHEISVTTLV